MSRTIHISHAGEGDDQPPEGVGTEWYGVKVWVTDPIMAAGLAAGLTMNEAEALSCLDAATTAIGIAASWAVPDDVSADLRHIRQWLLSLPIERYMRDKVPEGATLPTGVR